MSYDKIKYNLKDIFTDEEIDNFSDSWKNFRYRINDSNNISNDKFTIKNLEKILKNPKKYNRPENNLIYICVYLLKFERNDEIDKLISDYLLGPFFPPSKELFNEIITDCLSKIITIMKKYNDNTKIELFKIAKLERLLLEKNI